MTVNVLVELSNRNVDKTFTYNVPQDLIPRIKKGIRLKVPFGNNKLEGVVIDIDNQKEDVELKDIYEIVDDEVILNDELLELGLFLKEKTLSTLISCYQAMLPKALKASDKTNIRIKKEKIVSINPNIDLGSIKLNTTQKEIIDEINKGNIRKVDLLKINSSINTLIKNNVVIEEEVEKYREVNHITNKYEHFKLNKEQEKAVESILNTDKDVSLLFGVTGSGKTEVYMELIEKYIDMGKTAIVLVPEISLTPQMVDRFLSRFDKNIAILHSRLSDGEKYDEYRRIARGEVNIVIGARSAIFAPLSNLGIIIIDEEHTTTYKQENNPKYSAIDVAIERAKNNKAKVVLGSATPSLDSFARAYVNKYNLVELKTRANNKELPSVDLIDMNEEKNKSSHFSKKLIEEIDKTLDNNEQVILLLNRRGYASFITCSNCGYVSKCPNCDITLTYHKTSDMNRCHYCGYAEKRLDTCPKCHENSIKSLGYGTEKVEEELNKIFKDKAKVIRMDYDTTSTKGSHEKIINDFRDKKYNILLGTQMIAKGLDFKDVTLVGVINADTSLMIPNYRSSEYTFDLLSQVAGRSGRSEKQGRVIIQTFNKDHYAIKLAKKHDYINFFKEEMNIRKQLSYPPYTNIISIKIIGTDYETTKKESEFLKDKLVANIKSEVLGPSIGSTFRIKNTYRFGIIIKYKKDDTIIPYLKQCIEYYKNNNKVRLDIDFNPINI